MTAVIIIVVLLWFIYAGYLTLKYDMNGELWYLSWLVAVAFVCIVIAVDVKYPQPIDVYRGNTTLKISYIDSIPQDTIVVWKNNKNKEE